jgi:putative inorganic carbon (hco3(-)) transporter
MRPPTLAAMNLVERTLRGQRAVLAAVFVASALVFWRTTFTVYAGPKIAVVFLGVTALAVLGAVRVARTRRLVWPATPFLVPFAVLAAALVVATAMSHIPLMSLYGWGGRYTGLLPYLSYLVIAVTAVRLYRDHSPAHLASWAVVASVPVALYGWIQWFGLDPLSWGWAEQGPPMFGTIGNPNFFSAWMAVSAAFCAWGAATRTWTGLARLGAAGTGLLCVGAAAVSESLQGPAAAAVGLSLFAVVWLFTAEGTARRWRWPFLGAGTVLWAGLGTAFLAGAGPLSVVREMVLNSYRSRVWKWEPALAMLADRPLFGFGLDTYSEWFYTYRAADIAVLYGTQRPTDDPHNVVLSMLAGGGLLLGLAWVAAVGATGWALVRGLRRLEGEQRLLLGGFGAAWAAYQTQSLVSIDTPPLAILHWLTAGVIVALGVRPPLRETLLPGALAPVRTRPGKRRRRRDEVRLAPPSPVWTAGIGLLAVAGVALAFTTLAGDYGTGQGRSTERGNWTAALDAYGQGGRWNSWDYRPLSRQGDVLRSYGRHPPALAAYEAALERAPRHVWTLRYAARSAARTGELEKADGYYDRLLEADGDGKTPELVAEIARHRLDRDDVAGAAGLAKRLVDLQAEQGEWWVVLGDVYRAAGDRAAARAAYERALEIEPGRSDARQRIETLA